MFSITSSADLHQGLVAHYKLDGDASNEIENGNDGTVIGAMPAMDRFGNSGSAYSFDGIDDYIEIADHPDLNFGYGSNSSFSFSLWVKVDPNIIIQGGETVFLRKRDVDSGYSIELRDENPIDRPYVIIASKFEKLWASDPLPNMGDGQWHFLAFVRNGDTGTLYIDGSPNNSSAGFMTKDATADAPLVIGEEASQNGDYKGLIDDVRIYNRALSSEEIQQLFTLLPPPQLVCEGFEPPMDAYPVTVKGNRALPLKVQLFDANDYLVTDVDISAAPVLQVLYYASTNGDPVDVTSAALPAGKGTEGNQFVFTDTLTWQYNLKTKNYTAIGTYMISVVSGDDAEYMINPACVTSFERN